MGPTGLPARGRAPAARRSPRVEWRSPAGASPTAREWPVVRRRHRPLRLVRQRQMPLDHVAVVARRGRRGKLAAGPSIGGGRMIWYVLAVANTEPIRSDRVPG